MINNLNKDIVIQSYYSNNFESYRVGSKSDNGIMPHRAYCADFWDETIPLILDFLKKHDLKPHHKLLDLGAGAFRSGLALIPYLNSKNYYAIDINKFLLEDGYEYEIIPNNLVEKFPLNNIIICDDYNASDFNTMFDYVWSFSLWTHLGLVECEKSLKQVSKILNPGGIYLTTCFIVSEEEYDSAQIRSSDVEITTFKHMDPFHFTIEQLVVIGNKQGFEVEYCGIGSCCPRNHDVVKFVKK